MSDHCDAKWLPKPVECLAEPDHAGDHYGDDDAGFVVRWAPKSSVKQGDATGRTFDPETLVLALDAANLEIARLRVMLGHMTRIVRDYEIPHGLFTYDNTRLVEAETALTPKEP